MPGLQAIGLSATVAEPDALRRWLVAAEPAAARIEPTLITVEGGAKPDIAILIPRSACPGPGTSSRYAIPEIYEPMQAAQDDAALRQHPQPGGADVPGAVADQRGLRCRSRCTTARSTSASGARSRRRWQTNSLRAVVATSTLDLGIDWGDVDLVIHVGAPKGASRLAQRIGRANHRMDEPSKAILVPANRFEVLECRAALEANDIGAQDTPPLVDGALDVLAQHVLGMACAAPFDADELYRRGHCRRALCRASTAPTFDRVVDFVATGGYALRTYERYAKIRQTTDGLLARSAIRGSPSNTG